PYASAKEAKTIRLSPGKGVCSLNPFWRPVENTLPTTTRESWQHARRRLLLPRSRRRCCGSVNAQRTGNGAACRERTSHKKSPGWDTGATMTLTNTNRSKDKKNYGKTFRDGRRLCHRG